MANRSIATRFRSVLPAAAGGLVAGHFLTYVFLTPAGPQRAAFLRQTGHGYFPRAIAIGAALAAVAMGASVARGRMRRAAAGPRMELRSLAVRLALVQALGFVVMEVAERVAIGAPLGGLFTVLPSGFAVEALVAIGVAWILFLTERATATIVHAIARRTLRPRPITISLQPSSAPEPFVLPSLRHIGSSVTFRGPPVPSTN